MEASVPSEGRELGQIRGRKGSRRAEGQVAVTLGGPEGAASEEVRQNRQQPL